MYIYLLEVEMKVYEAYSLKDKRKVVKSIIDYSRNTLKISAAEISDNNIQNFAHLGFVTISNDNDTARGILERLLNRIIDNYPVELTYSEITRL